MATPWFLRLNAQSSVTRARPFLQRRAIGQNRLLETRRPALAFPNALSRRRLVRHLVDEALRYVAREELFLGIGFHFFADIGGRPRSTSLHVSSAGQNAGVTPIEANRRGIWPAMGVIWRMPAYSAFRNSG
jgi:hypothetical protein